MNYVPQTGDLVWARMKGYTPWPARVVKPGANVKKYKKGCHWIYFFGSNNYAWIEDKNIKPYEQYKNTFSNLCKMLLFKDAIKDIENYIEERSQDPEFENKFEDELLIKHPFKSARMEKATPVKRQSDTSSHGSATKKSKLSRSPLPQTPEQSPAPAPATVDSNEPSPSASPSSGTNLNENYSLDSIPYTDEIEALPPIFNKAKSSVVDLSRKDMKSKQIVASKLSFGFMGLGVMGTSIVKNLIISGHRVNLWNRTPEKCDEIKDQADLNNQSSLVDTYLTPTDVVQNSDIIFSCLADPASAKEIVVGNCGVVHDAEGPSGLEGKGYVEMTSIDPSTSHDISSIITSRGGRYLEAQLQGSKTQADDGSLIILAAGDQSLFNDCESCFKAMGKIAIYLGNTGYATKMNLYLNMALGIGLAGFAEGLTLAERSGLSIQDFLEIFNLTEVASNYLSSKGKQMIEKRFRDTEQAVRYMQKDIKLCLDISDGIKQNLPVAAATNEVYKTAARFNNDYDVCSIFNRMKN